MINMYHFHDKVHVVGGTFTHFPYSTEYNKLGSVGRIILDEEKYYGGYCLLVPRMGAYEKVKSDIARTLALTPEKPFVHVNSEISNLRDKLIIREIMVLQNIQLGAWILSLVSLVVCIMGIWSSISLDTRNRQKEVALRKIHGAHPRHIVRLFGAYYLRLLCIAALIVAVISSVPLAIFKVSVGYDIPTKEWLIVIGGLVFSQLLISAITLTTIARKIYRVSRINPAEVIKKD